MEITLEKIELVKDRTGVTYKEAKEALEKADGSVVDAIIAIEETVNADAPKSTGKASEVLEKVKELVNKGNVTKISVKRDDEILVNIPVNAGIVGAVLAPWGVVAAAIAAFGFKCKIELTTVDGKVINVSEKAQNVASDIAEKGAVAWDYAKEKAPEAWDFAKEKGEVAWSFAKEKGADVWEAAKEKGTDVWEATKVKIDDAMAKRGGKLFDDEDIDVDDIEIEVEVSDEEGDIEEK